MGDDRLECCPDTVHSQQQRSNEFKPYNSHVLRQSNAPKLEMMAEFRGENHYKKIRQEEESRGKEKSLVKWCMSLEEGVNLGCCSPSVCVLHCSFCSFLENEAQAPVRFQLQDTSDCTDRG